jgi:hypothetical protein
MKYLKIVSPIVIFGMIIGLCFLRSSIADDSNAVSDERGATVAKKAEYEGKRTECSGGARTASAMVNSAGVSYCGGEIAVLSNLEIRPLRDIYFSVCNMGFGVAVEGCTDPDTYKIYVCQQGTSVYDRRTTGVTRYFIYYQTVSYTCEDMNNTIRHELLHVVFLELDSNTQSEVNSKLASYKSQYSSEVSDYSESYQDDELFVRVGADGRSVSDPQLVDLYSQVSEAYVPQREARYASLVATSDQYIAKYEDLMEKYESKNVAVTTFIIINCIILITVIGIAIVRYRRNPKTAKLRKTAKRDVWDIPLLSSIKDELDELRSRIYGDDTEPELESHQNSLDTLRAKIHNTHHRSAEKAIKSKVAEEESFDEFKKQYGLENES